MPEIEKQVTHLPGVTMNPQTGEAHVPTPAGDVKVEVKKDGTPHFIFQDTPATHKLFNELIRKNSLEAEAAAAKGQSYIPTTGDRLKSYATSNMTPLKTVAFVVVGYTVYRIGLWAGRRMAEYFGWNLFGNEVMEDEEMVAGGTPGFDERRSPRRQRRPAEPTQPTAAA